MKASEERKNALIKKDGNLARRWIHVPRPTEIPLTHDNFYRQKEGKNLSKLQGQNGVNYMVMLSAAFFIACRPSDSSDVILPTV